MGVSEFPAGVLDSADFGAGFAIGQFVGDLNPRGTVKRAVRGGFKRGMRFADEGAARNFPRPAAEPGSSLDRTYRQLFRETDRTLGGTAQAIRDGNGHVEKGQERIRNIDNLLNTQQLLDADFTAVQVRNDLFDALMSQGKHDGFVRIVL